MDFAMMSNQSLIRRRAILEEALRESRLEKAMSQRLNAGLYGNLNNSILDLLATEQALKQQREYANVAALAVKQKIDNLTAVERYNDTRATPMTALSLLAAHLSNSNKQSSLASKYPMPNSVSSLSAALQSSTTSAKKYRKSAEKPKRRPKKTSASAISFPTKLFKLLESASDEGFEDVISFLPHGKGFMIHKPERFSEEILPKCFKTGRLSSFHRQLNLYGFKRITYGADTGAFFHEHFNRDDETVVAKIERKKQRVPEGDAGAPDRAAVLRALSIASAQSHY